MIPEAEAKTDEPGAEDAPLVLPLAAQGAARTDWCGGKAARLAALSAGGHAVPPGFVVTVHAGRAFADGAGLPSSAQPERVRTAEIPSSLEARVRDALAALGPGPLAVRSSAVGEDGREHSFAGMFESVLDVRGPEAVLDALRRVWASAYAARVRSYGEDAGGSARMAVLVQAMVDADAAGVAFTADPVTGRCDVVLVSAVEGLGEALVSGERSAEEWRVEGEAATRVQGGGVLDPARVREIAELARRLEREAGSPQDVEWALAGGRLFLLQARPMTALPEPVAWEAPPGCWMRNFRLGEWIGDPVTPSFESWLLTGIETAMHGCIEEACGIDARRPLHVTVNGWYFYGGMNLPSGAAMLRALPRLLWKTATRFREVASLTPPVAHLGFDWAARRWESELLPAYDALVAEAAETVERVPAAELPAWIDRLAEAAGRQFFSILAVGGYSAKAELRLWRFWRRHLAELEGSPHELIRSGEVPAPPPHAVQGLDWLHPTLGEMGLAAQAPDAATRTRIGAERNALESRALNTLGRAPKLRRRFEALLAEARRAHALREAQSEALTRPWPALRAAVLRLGGALVECGALAHADQVFFLTRDEILERLGEPGPGGASGAVGTGSLAALADERRATWERQRRLSPPLLLGRLPPMLEKAFAEIEGMIRGESGVETGPDVLLGHPGSPGRAEGRVRVIRSAGDVDRLARGEVLVAPVTTPAWTPAFPRAAAVVTDTGSIASHASIVAREYGLPAVVATGDATARLRDGQLVRVDGTRGLVRVLES